MLGTTLGQYRITGSIGLGGMGAVYSAEHTLLGRAAAVKVLRPELSQNQEVPTTAAGVAQRYADVGQQLKQLDQARGAEVTADLWPAFRRIRINDALVDPVKREEAEVSLRRLHDQIIERSR